jgi:prephenate dehydrogenase
LRVKMAVQIAIIGLGQIGASFGLALSERKELVQRIGHDKDTKVARQAEKIGALDRVETNLVKAVRDAELVLLCIPMDQIRETLVIIAPELKEGAVVMETGLAKEVVENWMKELLPAGRFYVGLTPVLNPAYLHDLDTGVEASHGDLFKGGLMGIVALPQTDSGAIKLAADLTRLVGSNPLFADPVEVDGLMSATQLLPLFLAAALLNTTSDQPGWWEGRKLAGRAYAEASAPIVQISDTAALCSAAVHNRENLVRLLDSLIASLQIYRSDIDEKNTAQLQDRLERARQARLKWWFERQVGDYPNERASNVEVPEVPGTFRRLFGGSPRPKKGI